MARQTLHAKGDVRSRIVHGAEVPDVPRVPARRMVDHHVRVESVHLVEPLDRVDGILAVALRLSKAAAGMSIKYGSPVTGSMPGETTAAVSSLERLTSVSAWSKRYSKSDTPEGSFPAPTMPTLACSWVGTFHSTPWIELLRVPLAKVLDDGERVVGQRDPAPHGSDGGRAGGVVRGRAAVFGVGEVVEPVDREGVARHLRLRASCHHSGRYACGCRRRASGRLRRGDRRRREQGEGEHRGDQQCAAPPGSGWSPHGLRSPFKMAY